METELRPRYVGGDVSWTWSGAGTAAATATWPWAPSSTQSREQPHDPFEKLVAALFCTGVDHLQHEQCVQHSRALHRRPASDCVGPRGIGLTGTASRFRDVEGNRTRRAAQLIQQRGVSPWNLFGSLVSARNSMAHLYTSSF